MPSYTRAHQGVLKPHGDGRLAGITIAPSQRVQRGTTVIATFDGKLAAEGTTFEEAKLPFLAT